MIGELPLPSTSFDAALMEICCGSYTTGPISNQLVVRFRRL